MGGFQDDRFYDKVSDLWAFDARGRRFLSRHMHNARTPGPHSHLLLVSKARLSMVVIMFPHKLPAIPSASPVAQRKEVVKPPADLLPGNR
jgi:hypothetical protein